MPFLPGDDYLYQLKFTADGTLSNARIHNLQDLIESGIHHYQNYNNRIIPHIFLQLILTLPSWVFDLINSLVFLLIPCLLLGKTKFSSRAEYAVPYLILILFLWIFHFDLGRSYFWTSGALNYSWPLLLQLYFVRRIYRWYNNPKESVHWHYLIIAFLICTTNENVVFGLAVITFWGLLLQYRATTAKVDLVVFFSALILLGGGILMLFSPALNSRLLNEAIRFESNTARILEYFRRTIFYFVATIPVLLIFLFNKKSFSISLSQGQKAVLSLIFLMSLVMLAAPKYDARSAIAGFVFALFLVVDATDFNRSRPWLIVLLILVSCVLMTDRFPLFQQLHERAAGNIKILENHHPHQDTAYLKPFCSSYHYNRCVVCDDLSDLPEYISKEPLAAYYNIPVVAIDPAYSFHLNRKNFLDSLRSGSPLNFEMLEINHPLTDSIRLNSYGVRDHRSGRDLIFQLEGDRIPDDYILILRGSPKGFNKYRIIDLLPLFMKIYLLEYLEHHSQFVTHQADRYAYELIFEASRYKYFIVSLYSLNNLEPVGVPIVIRN